MAVRQLVPPMSFAEAFAAGAGGIVSASALYPLEIAKNNMQASETPVPLADALATIVKKDGVRGLFRGVHLRWVRDDG